MPLPLPILQAQHLKLQRSILNPLILLNLIVWPSGLAAFAYLPEWAQMWLATGMAITLFSCLGAYAFFAYTDPDRLHSELHREIMRHYDLQGDDRRIPPEVIQQLPPVTNRQFGLSPDTTTAPPAVTEAQDG